MNLNNARSILGELPLLRRRGANLVSITQFAHAHILARRRKHNSQIEKLRQLRFSDGSTIFYRCNRGDLQSIREVWLEEHYRLPTGAPTRSLIDLGANIGLTTVWLTRHYTIEQIVAVEPDPNNLLVLKKNFDANNIKASVIPAAISPVDGYGHFENSADSNLGHLSDRGTPVKLSTMTSILDSCPSITPVDVMKLDIEGGEEQLLTGDLTWLQKIRFIIAELHPNACDVERVIRTLREHGFVFAPGASSNSLKMDTFYRS